MLFNYVLELQEINEIEVVKFDSTPYEEYVLEVADTNTKAVKLYEKLGYSEFLHIKQKHSKQSGINHLVYMKYLKNNN